MSLEDTTNTAKQAPQLDKQETNQSTASAGASDPLSGHLNHLSEKQVEALEAFKQQCVERNIYTPAKDGQAASHDDSTLLYVHTFNLQAEWKEDMANSCLDGSSELAGSMLTAPWASSRRRRTGGGTMRSISCTRTST